MSVKIGSARIDERGRASGGMAGDQTGREVAIENWYLHSLGWVVIRAKTSQMREKLAQDMEWACANKYIGYDQSQNTTLWNVAKTVGFDCRKVNTPCETDCARLVRVCCWYAGSQPVEFYTGSEVMALKATKDFDILTDSKYCKSSDYLLRGDILVTRSKGHTVIVLSNGSKAVVAPAQPNAQVPTSTEDLSVYIKQGQEWLNSHYDKVLRQYCGGLLAVDGVFGSNTRAACVAVWKDLCNRKYGTHLTPGNSNFLGESKKEAGKVLIQRGNKGTYPVLAKLLLTAKGYKCGKVSNNEYTATAVEQMKAFQKAQHLTVTGTTTAETWYKLFN